MGGDDPTAPPPLGEVVNTLKDLAYHPGGGATESHRAHLYSAALAFLKILHDDGQTLRNRSDGKCPPLSEIPSIGAVLQDGDLYRTLLSMLGSKPLLMDPSTSSSITAAGSRGGSMKRQLSAGTANAAEPRTPGATITGSSGASRYQQTPLTASKTLPSTGGGEGGRKRSASVSALGEAFTPKIKQAKLTLSPGSSRKLLATPGAGADSVHSSQRKLAVGESFDVAAFAATVLYAVFAHLDHWPAELVKAYADDCFGPRLWADNEDCKLLVQNLALAHSSGSSNVMDQPESTEAQKFADYYTYLVNMVPKAVGGDDNDDDNKSSSSSGSDSGEEECLVEVATGTMSATAKLAPEKAMADDASSSSGDSDSGDEEVLVDESGTARGGPPANPTAMALAALSHYQGTSSEPQPGETQDGKSPSQPKSAPDADDVSMADASSVVVSSVPIEAVPPDDSSVPLVVPVDFPSQEGKTLNLTPIRRRYIGPAISFAHEAIGDALEQRLDAKVKQNSRLLSTLPSFIAVPQVRRLCAGYLERWLQSPAISGLARPLFVALVQAMQRVEPPLQEDIDAIDCILSMKLKANQLNTHIDNVKKISVTLPTLSVSQHIFSHLLRQAYSEIENPSPSQGPSPSMTFLLSVTETLPSDLASEALAASLCDIINEHCSDGSANEDERNGQELNRLVTLVRKVASALGASFNGNSLAKMLVTPSSDSQKELALSSLLQADALARILFELMALMAPVSCDGRNKKKKPNNRQASSVLRQSASMEDDGNMQKEVEVFKNTSSSARKAVLRWCLSAYAKVVGANETDSAKNGAGFPKKRRGRRKAKEDSREALVGAGIPDYESVLDGESPQDHCKGLNPPSKNLLRNIRCLLFLVPPGSTEMSTFLGLSGDSSDSMSDDQRSRVQLCHDSGLDVDEEVVRIVLDAAKAPAPPVSQLTALAVIEHLFFSCRVGRSSSILVKSPSVVWDIYDLTIYTPVNTAEGEIGDNGVSPSDHEFSDDDDGSDSRKRKRGSTPEKNEDVSSSSSSIPKLAYPGLWWRATSLVLAICGTDTTGVGATLWEESSTLRAIIKMSTSGRYRFPTVDCDDELRDEMKRGEADMRDQELKITEQLFLPKSQDSGKKKKQDEEGYMPKGSRVSARQRAKRDQLIALQREKEAALALAEAQRRKKLLKAAQKSIMIWDPRGPSRKPPKDSVGLILSVGEMFGISERFRLSQSPDYLLRAIGSTSRASIERAYDWLIPIISSYPETINRLPSSASCFLLLRAYGAEGGENDQLLKLSAPLRSHVGSCISGEFGESAAIKAADLLFHDMADSRPDRRLCARRVLQEATHMIKPKEEDNFFDLGLPDENDLSWLLSLTTVKFARGTIDVAIQHMSHAVAYERGAALRSLLMALDAFISFAHREGFGQQYVFGDLLCELLALRPHVCCDVVDRFADLRDLALSVVARVFRDFVDKGSSVSNGDEAPASSVKVAIRRPSEGDAKFALDVVQVPYHVLQAALVVIGNWPGDKSIDFGVLAVVSSTEDLSNDRAACAYLVQSLIVPAMTGISGMQQPGAAGAVFTYNERRAVSVENWVMLAKCRCDSIAKLAALSAPDTYLPRLLLCCGITTASLLSMIARLGKIGSESPDSNKYFSQLLAPSAISAWGTGYQIGGRRVVARKLLGRISAYFELNGSGIQSSPFLTWLVDYCREEKSTKAARRKAASQAPKAKEHLPDFLSQVPTKGSLSKLLLDDEDEDAGIEPLPFEADEVPVFAVAKASCELPVPSSDGSFTTEAFEQAIAANDFVTLDSMAASLVHNIENRPGTLQNATIESARCLLLALSKPVAENIERHPLAFVNFVLKWYPFLSQFGLSQDTDGNGVFETIFRQQNSAAALGNDTWSSILRTCVEFSWTEAQIRSCQTWILDGTQNDEEFLSRHCPRRMTDFLIHTSNQCSVAVQPFACASIPPFVAIASQAHASSAVKLALECARIENEASNASSHHCADRNMLPTWFVLLELTARSSKKHLTLVTGCLVSQLPTDGWKGTVYPLILLRLYVALPSMMSLGDAKLREVLISAVGNPKAGWLELRCPLDDQVRSMVQTLGSNWNQRLLQTMMDISKRQPLIMLRHLRGLADVLLADGAVLTSALTRRNRTVAGASQGPAVAKTKQGAILKVSATHWGYCFTEPLWSSVLEIISSLPNEVAFVCGLKMGLVEIYGAFVKLIWVQHSLKCPDHTARIRTKLAACFASFNSFDALAWAEWMESRLEGLRKQGPVRDIWRDCQEKTASQY